MKLRVYGKHPKASNEIIKGAVRWSIRRLLARSISEKLSISIHFANLSDKHEWSIVYATSRRKFSICVNLSVTTTLRKLLIALFHETVHIRQFATGELGMQRSPCTRRRWRDSFINVEEIDYHQWPWEKEAWSSEKKLYAEWKKLCHLRH